MIKRERRVALTSNGVKIRTALAEKNMTQRQLAKELEIREASLGEFMRGNRGGTTFIKRIEQILDIELLI